jgi:hypothetical protein
LEQRNEQDIFTVFTLDDDLIFEILRNEPHDNPLTDVSKTPTGVISVAQKGANDFIYKVRPEYKGSSIVGIIKEQEIEIKITDTAIYVGTHVFQGNMVAGCEVGIIVLKDGLITIGAQLPVQAKRIFLKQ